MVSHRAAWLRAIEHDDEGGATGRRGDGRDVRAVPHGGLDVIEDRVGGRPPRPPRPPARSARAPRHRRAVARERASTASPGCGNASSTTTATYDTSPLVEVLTGTSLVTPRAHRRDQGALPRILDVGRVRLDRDRSRGGAARPRPLRPTRQRRAAAAHGRRRRWPTTASSGCAARPCSRATSTAPTRPRRRSTRRAGSTPATWRRATPTASSPSPVVVPSRSARAANGWRRSRSRARSLTHPAVVEVRCRRDSPTNAGAKWCARRSSCSPGASLPTVEEIRAHVASSLVGAEAAPDGGAGRHVAPHRRDRADPAAAPARRVGGRRPRCHLTRGSPSGRHQPCRHIDHEPTLRAGGARPTLVPGRGRRPRDDGRAPGPRVARRRGGDRPPSRRRNARTGNVRAVRGRPISTSRP